MPCVFPREPKSGDMGMAGVVTISKIYLSTHSQNFFVGSRFPPTPSVARLLPAQQESQLRLCTSSDRSLGQKGVLILPQTTTPLSKRAAPYHIVFISESERTEGGLV